MKSPLRNGAFVAMSILALIGPGPQRSLALTDVHASSRLRTLTFADRVAYQYAIEEVYWRHRIWPKENPGPKPSLDQVMSAAQIERKVEDYLRKSQLLADQRRPIMPEQLQAELDRMASHTKQPDVLRELFAALNNDPFVIAECLARPTLVERAFVNELSRVQVQSRNPTRLQTDGTTRAQDTVRGDTYRLSEISVPLDCTNDTWMSTAIPYVPNARDHTAVWTGSEMIVWGRYYDQIPAVYRDSGSRYSPATDTWTPTSTTGAPIVRYSNTAMWTGSEMIIWGGYDGTNFFDSGGRYNPSTDTWVATSITNAPAARYLHTAVWTGQ